MVHSVPEPAALSVFAVALILLGLLTNLKARRAVRAVAEGARRRVAAAFMSARKMLKNGASEGT
jgi:hypothetical protein